MIRSVNQAVDQLDDNPLRRIAARHAEVLDLLGLSYRSVMLELASLSSCRSN